jgi:hypothetical protein
MGWFNRRTRTLADDELREAIFNAVADSNRSALTDLLTTHRERVNELFPTWTRLPESIRADPARMHWWATGMIGIASALAASGDGSLMERLQGPRETNPLMEWQEAFVAAEADGAAGRYASGIRRLEDVLEKATDFTGPGVDHLRPKIYGLLGTLHYRAGNRTQARDFTIKARTDSERTGDHEGAAIYARNLEVIDGRDLTRQS